MPRGSSSQSGDDSKDLAVLWEQFANLFHYLMGNGQEGKIARMDREQKESVSELKKEVKEALAENNERLTRIEDRIGKIIVIVAWLGGGAGAGIGAGGVAVAKFLFGS
jgi:hypothetical protein